MRTLLISLFLSVFTLSPLDAQNLDKLLQQHYKASGQEKLSRVTTVITKGKMTYVTAGMESAVTLYQSKPNKLRMEASILGSKVIQTYNGQTGWIYAPAMGIAQAQKMGAAEIRAVLQHAQFESPLWNYKENGNTVELAGSSEDGTAHLLNMTQKGGEEIILLLDKKTHLITGTTSKSVIGGSETVVILVMKDYKTVKGIQTAHYISTKINGELVVTLDIESIEYGKSIDQDIFEKPSTEKEKMQ